VRKLKTSPMAVPFQKASTLKNQNTLVARAVLAALYATPVISTSLSAAPLEASKITYNLDIPAQKLSDALQSLALATRHRLVYSSEVVDGKRAPAVRGGFTTTEAVERLLAGTGLKYEVTEDGLVVIKDGRESAKMGAKNAGVSNNNSEQWTVAQSSPAAGEDARRADEASPSPSQEEGKGEVPVKIEEVVVTASRRQQRLEEVPYSLTAISADQIARTGVTDLASLARQVPGLSMYDFGARSSSSVYPVIRGLNASAAADQSSGSIRTFEQSPVGTYIGNSPIDGYFQFDDVQRVEVLKGPQGTLYGAGALGGALRIIPNAPQLDSLSGNLEAGGGTLAHSSGVSYNASGVLNVPVADTLAFRFAGKYAYQPGFANVYGILERTGSPPVGGVPVAGGIPVLANPADPVNSSGIFSGNNDWNHQNTFTGRASLLWKPADRFNAQLAFMYAQANGDGGPVVTPSFPGGPYPIDPRITFPRGGGDQLYSAVDQPFSSKTELTSLDLSYDAGFATLSSTSSYFTRTGSAVADGTYIVAAYPGLVPYYAGIPINPRLVSEAFFVDSVHTFTQEVRLVSTTGPEKLFDYVVGVFYENQGNSGSLNLAQPGSPERSLAQGCTAPSYFGATFPNCLVVTGPGDISYQVLDTQRFEDKSEFAELTWHFVPHGQITFGGRHFEQSFTDAQLYAAYTFAQIVPVVPHSTPASKNTWKINPSYEYASGQYVYALWSQGFRRGGANALPLVGPFRENPVLLNYAPDSVNNYEVGLKGRFADGLSYTFDVFDVLWDKPQIAGTTTGGNFAVWNANKARSKGLEFDLNTPLFLSGLSLTVSGSYVDAKLTENYLISDTYGDIVGTAGQQLPGSPKVSAAATINYERKLAPDYDLTVSLNDTYRSAETLSTFPVHGVVPEVSGMGLANLSASVSHQSWRLGLYVTNVTDKRWILAPQINAASNGQTLIATLAHNLLVNQPREIGLRVGYSF